MKLDMDNLSKYDLTNAKAGDKIIVGHDSNFSFWSFKEVTIKSVSPKRGDITLSDGSRYQKDGRKMGVGRWISRFVETAQGYGNAVNCWRGGDCR